jgi:hypothetical protein
VSFQATGLSGSATAAPGAEIQIFTIGLVGDGADFITQIRVQLDDLSSATGISTTEISELKLYESTDATFGGDTEIANQTTVNVSGSNTSLLGAGTVIPNTVTYHYFVTAIINTSSVTEGHSFRLGFATNNAITNLDFVGTAIAAADADNISIDVTGTQLSLTTAPSDGDVFDTGNDEVVSASTFDVQPVITVIDANSNVDADFSPNVVASKTNGSGTLGGTLTVSPSNGVATFTDLAYTAASDGEGFEITFSTSGVTLVTTAGTLSADVIATRLILSQQASGAVNGVALSTQPVITARDGSSLTDTDFTDTVTLTASGSGSLANQTLSATSGVATFSTILLGLGIRQTLGSLFTRTLLL